MASVLSQFSLWLELPFLCRIGLYSYGMYVYHQCIMLLIQRTHLINGVPHARAKMTLAVVATAVTFVVAASYHGLEQPFLKLKSRF
jgi:peptidoglycan/LPS O-acetylase OafA/YrhL